LEYDDHAEAVMPEEDKPMRLTRITLRPRIVVGSGVKEGRVLRLTEMAHEQCYITNSLSTEVVVEPAPPFPAAHPARTKTTTSIISTFIRHTSYVTTIVRNLTLFPLSVRRAGLSGAWPVESD
jgi:hypothetical protein